MNTKTSKRTNSITRVSALAVAFTACNLGGEVDLGPGRESLADVAGAGGEDSGDDGTAGEISAVGGSAGTAGSTTSGGTAGVTASGGSAGTAGAAGAGGNDPGSCYLHTENFFPFDPERVGCACDAEEAPICAQQGSLICDDGHWLFAPTDCEVPTRCAGDLDFSDEEGSFLGCICDPTVVFAEGCWRGKGFGCAPAGFLFAFASENCAEAHCYSPTQNADLIGEDGAIGCKCDPSADADVCAEGWGFICSDGRWTAAQDGPCWVDNMPD